MRCFLIESCAQTSNVSDIEKLERRTWDGRAGEASRSHTVSGGLCAVLAVGLKDDGKRVFPNRAVKSPDLGFRMPMAAA